MSVLIQPIRGMVAQYKGEHEHVCLRYSVCANMIMSCILWLHNEVIFVFLIKQVISPDTVNAD